MPYKRYEDFAAWNRNYQHKRAAGERQDRATIEGAVIDLVREEPSQHDVFSLYARLRIEGWPARMLQRAVQDLLKIQVLRWDGRASPLHTGARLMLNPTHAPFLASPSPAPSSAAAPSQSPAPSPASSVSSPYESGEGRTSAPSPAPAPSSASSLLRLPPASAVQKNLVKHEPAAISSPLMAPESGSSPDEPDKGQDGASLGLPAQCPE